MVSIKRCINVTPTITRCDGLLDITFEHVCIALQFKQQAVREALSRAGYTFNPNKSYLHFSDMVRWVQLKQEYVV